MTTALNPSQYLNTTFRGRLLETKVKDVIPRWKNLVIARSTDTIATVFSKLIDNQVLGVPLLDTSTNKYTAFIDLFDILSYVVEVLNLPIEPSEDWVVSSQFAHTSCLTLVGRSIRSSWMLVGEDAPLQAAINQLQTVHRVAVIDSAGNLVSVLSQSRVARWLAQHDSEWVMGDIAGMSVEQFKLGYCDVVTVSRHEKTVNAFLRMHRDDLSGVGVVDDDDTMIGNISISDIKDIGYSAGMFRRLYVECGAFLSRKIEGGLVPKLVYANRTTQIKDVLEKFRDHAIHRVYVVTAGFHKPLGVITLTDVMRVFASGQGIVA
jgi:CBS domain-containing protein